jgi:uncharacterized membrane protein (UPF0127 family)
VNRGTAVTAWLLREGEVLASVEIPPGPLGRVRGLLGRDGVDGGLVLRPCRSVHTIGMRFPIDVAFCDRDGRVLHRTTLRPWRMSRLVWRSRFAIEAEAGAFERWRLAAGDIVEIKE